MIRLSVSITLAALLVEGWACVGAPPTDWAELRKSIRGRYPDVKAITTGELAVWLAADTTATPLLLDVRTEEEYDTSHLKGAVRAENVDDAVRVLQGAEKDRPVVAYCSVGYRSAALVAGLQKRGFRNVMNLEGSIFQWANDGRPVYRGGIRVSEVHPYDDQWGALLDRKYHPGKKR